MTFVCLSGIYGRLYITHSSYLTLMSPPLTIHKQERSRQTGKVDPRNTTIDQIRSFFYPSSRKIKQSKKPDIMHGTSCPKCGASSDGSSKTCGGCGAVSYMPLSSLSPLSRIDGLNHNTIITVLHYLSYSRVSLITVRRCVKLPKVPRR